MYCRIAQAEQEVDKLAENGGFADRKYVGYKETVLYGIANSGQTFGYGIITSYLSFFYVNVFGIPAPAVAAMIAVVGIWDTFNDPLMGSLIDKTRTRYGKLRPYLYLVPVPLGVATAVMFAGPLMITDPYRVTAKIVFMYVSYIMWEFFYTIGDVPFWGMSAAVSPNPRDRTSVITSARLISSLGGLGSIALTVMIDLSNKGYIGLNLQQVFAVMGCVAGVMVMCVFSLSGFFVKERVVQSIEEPGVLQSFAYMFRNKPLALIILANVLGSFGGIAGIFSNYYFIDVLGTASANLIIGIPGVVVGFISFFIIGKVKSRLNNKQIIYFINLYGKALSIATFFICLGNTQNLRFMIPALMVKNTLGAITGGIGSVVPTEMIGDTVDYMEWTTGKRSEGMSFSVLTFVGKFTGSASRSLGTALLPLIGYRVVNGKAVMAGGPFGIGTKNWIWAFYTIIPDLLGLLSLVPYFFYDLVGEKHARMMRELADRREKLAEQVTADNR